MIAAKCDGCHEQGPTAWSFYEADGFDRLKALQNASMVEQLDGRYLRQFHADCLPLPAVIAWCRGR